MGRSRVSRQVKKEDESVMCKKYDMPSQVFAVYPHPQSQITDAEREKLINDSYEQMLAGITEEEQIKHFDTMVYHVRMRTDAQIGKMECERRIGERYAALFTFEMPDPPPYKSTHAVPGSPSYNALHCPVESRHRPNERCLACGYIDIEAKNYD